MSELSVWLKVDGREVRVCTLEYEGDAKFTPQQIVQMTVLAAIAVGAPGKQMPVIGPDDPVSAGDRFQRLLYGEQKVHPGPSQVPGQ